MKLRSMFDSREESHRIRMGGYEFAMLEYMLERAIGTWFSVATFRITDNEMNDLVYVVRNEANVLAFVKGGNLVAIDGDFRFADMGLMLHSGDQQYTRGMAVASVQAVANMQGNYGNYELMFRAEETQTDVRLAPQQYQSEAVVDLFTQSADKMGAKLEKRAGSIARPVRVSYKVSGQPLKVLVLPESPTLDGMTLVNGKLLDQGIINISTPEWMPEQRAHAIKYLDKQMVWNIRGVGDFIFVDAAGKPIVLDGHIKGQAIRDDNMPEDIAFITSMDNIKVEMHPVAGGCGWTVVIFDPQGMKDAFNDQQTIAGHPFLLSIPDVRNIVTDEARKSYSELITGSKMAHLDQLQAAEWDKRFSWEGESFNRMLRWRTSAWMLYGMSYLDSKWLTEQLGMQWTQTLNWNSVNWSKTLKVRIPCAVRAQVVSASSVNLHSEIDMHPEEGTPEWCEKLNVLVMNDLDWIHWIIASHGGCDLDDFFVIRWVTVNGEKKILITRNPNARGEYTLWNYKEGDWFPTHTTSKGEVITFPAITKKRWPKQILKALEDGDTTYLKLPTETDPDATLEDDRLAVLNEQQNILSRILASGKGVDAAVANRLGVDDIPVNYEGVISRSKTVMAEIITAYIKRVYDFSLTLPIPTYLEELGNNEMTKQAKELLMRSRRAMYNADHSQYETEQDKKEAVKKAQEDILLPSFASTDRVVNARFALALWYACRTTPTSKGKITDQAIFGTDVFDYLLDGLLYLGIAQKPGYASVWYMGNHVWMAKCRVCGEEFDGLNIHQLVAYHNADRICKSCR